MICFSRHDKISQHCFCEVWPAIIGGIAGLAGAGIGAASASSINQQTMAFNKQEAEKNRVFQQEQYWQNVGVMDRMRNEDVELANTAVQRHVADLTAAGLNPIMAAGGQGAGGAGSTSPHVGSGSQASVSGLHSPGESIQRGINEATVNALSYRRLKKDVEQAGQEIKESKARAEANYASAHKNLKESEKVDVDKANALLEHQILKNEVSSSKAVNDYKKKSYELEQSPWLMYPKKAMEVLSPVIDATAKGYMIKKGTEALRRKYSPKGDVVDLGDGTIIKEKRR